MRGDWGHRLSPIAPGATCSLCGHTGTQAEPVLSTYEGARVEDDYGQLRPVHYQSLRCENAFACQDRQAKRGGARW